MKRLSILFFFLISTATYSQYDTAQVTKLINKVYSLQVVDDNFYDEGLFKTQREWGESVMEDNSFFYTASMLYIFQQLYPKLSIENKMIVDTIYARATNNVTKYANRKGEASYNFWQTNPDTPHPNGKAEYRQSKYGLPDDLDDSVIIASILQNDSISILVRGKMVAYAASNNHKPIQKAPKGYQTTEAYRIWFADQWTQEIDVVVLCNILLFVFENQYALNKYDLATIDFVKKVVTDGDHVHQPKEISPYYGRPAVILYHLARTIAGDTQGVLQSIKTQTISDLENLLPTVQNEYEKMMVVTSLYRLGKKPVIAIDTSRLLSDRENFYFFYSTSANISFPQYKLWIIKTFGLIPNLYWKCDVFNKLILLEFLMTTGYSLDSGFL
jgi:hypothetical protein